MLFLNDGQNGFQHDLSARILEACGVAQWQEYSGARWSRVAAGLEACIWNLRWQVASH